MTAAPSGQHPGARGESLRVRRPPAARWAAFLMAGTALLVLLHLLSRQRARLPEDEADHTGVQIQAPIRGRFFHPLNNGVPFVRVGDHIAIGKPIGLVVDDAGLMHEIRTADAGRVVRVLAENRQRVAVGAPLLLIEEPAHER